MPTLPGCITYGETVDEFIANAKEAVELYIESLEADGEEIPTEEEFCIKSPLKATSRRSRGGRIDAGG